MVGARNVAVLIYEGVDTLDLAGPFDVFAVSSRWGKDLCVYTVGERNAPATTVSGVTVSPRYSFEDCPSPDILVVPGGLGSRKEMHNETLTDWVRDAARDAEIVLSVCTGALLLAKAGLLADLRITTNRSAFDLLQEAAPASATIVRDVRYVDNGKIVMSGGVTTGMDAALHIVSRLFGAERAITSASLLEYAWQPSAHIHDDSSSPGDTRQSSAEPTINPSFSQAITNKFDDGQASDSDHMSAIAAVPDDRRAVAADLDIRPATASDKAALRELYLEASDWIRNAKGIRQWNADMFSDAKMEQLFREQDVFAAYLNGKLAGAFSINWHKEEGIWTSLYHSDAGYVHRLAVARDCRGLGIGALLLHHAAREISRKGRSWLRLDCMADNPSLNAYYRSQGLQYRGRYDGEGWSASLYERKVGLA